MTLRQKSHSICRSRALSLLQRACQVGGIWHSWNRRLLAVTDIYSTNNSIAATLHQQAVLFYFFSCRFDSRASIPGPDVGSRLAGEREKAWGRGPGWHPPTIIPTIAGWHQVFAFRMKAGWWLWDISDHNNHHVGLGQPQYFTLTISKGKNIRRGYSQ